MMMQTWFTEWVTNDSGDVALYSVIDLDSLLSDEIRVELESLPEAHVSKLRFCIFRELRPRLV